MTDGLAGKAVLVTGGGSGIGRAACEALGRAGVKVMVSDVAVDGGEETAHLIERAGGQAAFLRADAADRDAVEHLVDRTATVFGRLDGAFNNAGISGAFSNLVDYKDDEFDRVIAINLKGVWLCMRAELRKMQAQQTGGAIVNTASIMGLVGIQMSPAYTAAKHGVVGLTKTAALEYAKVGIRVNAVCPGVIDTPMVANLFAEVPRAREPFHRRVPMERLGEPREIGDTVAWLLSDAASFVTGVALPVDGAWTAQ